MFDFHSKSLKNIKQMGRVKYIENHIIYNFKMFLRKNFVYKYMIFKNMVGRNIAGTFDQKFMLF